MAKVISTPGTEAKDTNEKEDRDPETLQTFLPTSMRGKGGSESVVQRIAVEELEQENWNVRINRYIAHLAGLPTPPGKSEYLRLEQSLTQMNPETGEVEKPSMFQMMSAAMVKDIMSTAKVLHIHATPYDVYRLMKESSPLFAMSIILTIIIAMSCVFGAWATALGCIDPSPSSFIPRGFMIVSGLGTGVYLHHLGDTEAYEDPSDGCLWMEAVGVFFGVYTLLPCFGALVLIRLLDNGANIIKISDTLLLTKRFGQPCLQFRVASASGCRLHNLQCSLTIGRTYKDAETGEGFIAFHNIALDHPASLDAYALNVVHYADENSSLMTKGKELVEVDEKGVPHWHCDVMFCAITVKGEQEQGGRTTISYKRALRSAMIMANEEGELPQWRACMVYQGMDWITSKGEKCQTIDMSALSKWEHKKPEPLDGNV